MNKIIQTTDQKILKSSFNIFFTFALCLGFILSSEAQDMEWAPVGTTWHFEQVSVLGPEVSYTYVESVESTFYQGQECKRLDGLFAGCSWPVPEEGLYTYKSNDSVYFYHPQLEEFKLLYDFGASVGDTWTVHNIALEEENPNSTEIRVDSTGVTTIDGIELRVLYTSMVEYTPDSSEQILWNFGGKIIENIGSVFYILPYYWACDPWPGAIRCYQDESIFYHPSEFSCEEEYTVSNGPEINARQLKISPNPARNEISVSWVGRKSPGQLLIYDVRGRLFKRVDINNRVNRISVDLSDLNPGKYFINLEGSDLEYNPVKIIKQ